MSSFHSQHQPEPDSCTGWGWQCVLIPDCSPPLTTVAPNSSFPGLLPSPEFLCCVNRHPIPVQFQTVVAPQDSWKRPPHLPGSISLISGSPESLLESNRCTRGSNSKYANRTQWKNQKQKTPALSSTLPVQKPWLLLDSCDPCERCPTGHTLAAEHRLNYTKNWKCAGSPPLLEVGDGTFLNLLFPVRPNRAPSIRGSSYNYSELCTLYLLKLVHLGNSRLFSVFLKHRGYSFPSHAPLLTPSKVDTAQKIVFIVLFCVLTT